MKQIVGENVVDGDLCFLTRLRRMSIKAAGKLDGLEPVGRIFPIADTILPFNGNRFSLPGSAPLSMADASCG